jgi:hypothetical protein
VFCSVLFCLSVDVVDVAPSVGWLLFGYWSRSCDMSCAPAKRCTLGEWAAIADHLEEFLKKRSNLVFVSCERRVSTLNESRPWVPPA